MTVGLGGNFLFFVLSHFFWPMSLNVLGLPIPPTATLPSCTWSFKDLPISSRLSPTNCYCTASSALLQLVDHWFNFTSSRSHAFKDENLKKINHHYVKNRTREIRTIILYCSESRGYLLVYDSADESIVLLLLLVNNSEFKEGVCQNNPINRKGERATLFDSGMAAKCDAHDLVSYRITKTHCWNT